ncbi:DNA alkylation repair protein [Flavobacteriaceae bacterium R38]|nr:DNA alkylation repair protein [Flavobacteriaceae bacterium R38]
MKTITRKSEVKIHLEKCLTAYHSDGLNSCVSELNDTLLSNKVKFPLLEFCAGAFYEYLPKIEHIQLCDQIQSLRTEGGNVILGIMLQKRLADDFKQSLHKTTEYVADADVWYICDIIGERVFGFSLLHQPEKTIPEIKRLSHHPVNWVVRSLGAGIHYAIKKGLHRDHVATVFKILLSKADAKDKEIKQGIGWAVKTTAKFHPDIIDQFKDEIYNTDEAANWFRAKIAIGLNRHHYAKRNRS